MLKTRIGQVSKYHWDSNHPGQCHDHGWTIYIEGAGKAISAQVLRTLLKKTISLCLDNAGKTIMSDAIISNLFIKIPDISVSILSEAGTKIGCDPNELILLDVKFSDEKGILMRKVY